MALDEFLQQHQRTRLEVLTDLLVRTILDQNPGYRATEVVPLQDLRRSCRDNIERVLGLILLPGGTAWAEPHHFDAAERTGRQRAQQGLPLDDVLRSFRLGGALIWKDLIEQSRALDALDADGLREVGTRLWEVVDLSSAHVAAAYHSTERERAVASEQRSAALWEELLAGRGRDLAFAVEAARTLRLPMRGSLVVSVLSDAPAWLEPRLRSQGIASAWHRRTDSAVGIVDVGAVGVSAVVETLGVDRRVRGGMSRVVTQFTDVVEAFGQAELALRTLEPGEVGVVSFDDRLVEELLLAAPDIADRLVEVWVRPLLVLPESEHPVLLATLQAWVDCGGSMTRTARAAHCHRNTAINRLGRIGAVLGVRLTEGPVPAELLLALRAWRLRHGS